MKSKKSKLAKDQENGLKQDYKESFQKLKQTEDIDEILALTKHENADIRLKSCAQLCPCKLQEDHPEFWVRIFQMAEDPDARVRARILHIIADGSPNRVEQEVVQALEKLNRDPDKEIKRRAHKVLTNYLRTGKWNIL